MPALVSSRLDAPTEDICFSIYTATLFRQVEESRATIARALDELGRKLDAVSSALADPDFPGLIKLAQKLLKLDDLEMSRLLKVSRPTIGRWVRGVSAPHPLARKAIFDVLAKKARADAKSLRK
jgi:hypothetical protein